MDKIKNIALIGLMGAGKTSVGKLLAKKLNFVFIDIDSIIEQKELSTIAEIFETKGEHYFRRLEVTTIAEYSDKFTQIISTGGGAPQNPINIENLKKNGLIFYLYAPVNILYNRLLNEIDNRPMLNTDNPLKRLEELLNKREPYYLNATYRIDTIDKTLEQIALEIILLYRNYGK